MPLPIIAGGAVLAKKVGAGLAAKKAAGVGATTAGRVAARRTASSQTTRHGVGRTASGKTLQAAKPRKQWDWTNLASNFESNDGGFV